MHDSREAVECDAFGLSTANDRINISRIVLKLRY